MRNNDLDKCVFDRLLISDKRSYIRVSKATNCLSKHIPNAELEFQKMIRTKNICYNYNNLRLWNPLCKYTVELLFDNRIIPDAYVTADNKIFVEHHNMYNLIGKKRDLKFISKLLDCDLGVQIHDHIAYGAAKEGRIDVLELIREKHDICEYATATAAKGGKMETLVWLIKNDVEMSYFGFGYAIKRGHFDICEYITEIIDVDTNDCNYEAGLSGNLHVAKYIHSRSPDSVNKLCNGAAEGGHIDIVKYCYKLGGCLDKDFFCKSIPIFEWLIDNSHIVPDVRMSARIALSGDLECLQYVHSRGFLALSEEVFVMASNKNNLAMMKWLRDIHCPIPLQSIDLGHTGWCDDSVCVLKLLVNLGCTLSNKIDCVYSSQTGNLEMLKYLHAKGGELNIRVMNAAAEKGHLHVIAWCRSKGCAWYASTCAATVRYNHIHVLKWLRGIGRNKYDLGSDETEICPWDGDVYVAAIQYSNVNVLKFAIDNGCPAGERAHVARNVAQCPKIESLMMEYENCTKNI